MAILKVEGFVLRTRDLGEAHKILILLTLERGKVSAVARGARRARSRLLATSQPFTHSRFLLYEGRGLHSVSQAELISSFRPLREDLSRMAYASYLAELLDAFVEEDEPHAALYRTVLEGFTLISGTSDLELATRWFELHVLEHLGYRPELAQCVGCGESVEGVGGVYRAEQGGVLCKDCQGPAGGGIVVSPAVIAQCMRLSETPAARLGILRPSRGDRSVMEQVLRAHIDHRLDRPLRSRDFLQSLYHLGSG